VPWGRADDAVESKKALPATRFSSTDELVRGSNQIRENIKNLYFCRFSLRWF
jgi:hypothetical protein